MLQGSSDKLNGQLKMHLDSIFDGFQKLISGTEETQERRQLPFVIEKTIHNILFIKTHMQRQDEFDAVSEDYHDLYVWKSVGINWSESDLLCAGGSRLGYRGHGARQDVSLGVRSSSSCGQRHDPDRVSISV